MDQFWSIVWKCVKYHCVYCKLLSKGVFPLYDNALLLQILTPFRSYSNPIRPWPCFLRLFWRLWGLRTIWKWWRCQKATRDIFSDEINYLAQWFEKDDYVGRKITWHLYIELNYIYIYIYIKIFNLLLIFETSSYYRFYKSII